MWSSCPVVEIFCREVGLWLYELCRKAKNRGAMKYQRRFQLIVKDETSIQHSKQEQLHRKDATTRLDDNGPMHPKIERRRPYCIGSILALWGACSATLTTQAGEPSRSSFLS